MARLALIVALAASASVAALAPTSAKASLTQKSAVLNKLAASGLGAALAAASFAGSVAPAFAYEGVYGMDTVKAKDAARDTSAYDSDAVRKAVRELNDMGVATMRIKAAIDENPQFDVVKCIRNDMETAAVRNTFNNLNAVYDEDTQKSTDKLQRGILQEIFEVEARARTEPGKFRSEKKVAATKDSLNKLVVGFQKLDAFYF